jgi:oligopeptide/dipeptide ABC transporter ATP-binding protein
VSCATEPLLAVRDVRVAFGGNDHAAVAVDGLSYDLFSGKTLAIIGESGSGKTASCRALMGLLPHDAAISGSARLGGRELLGLNEAAMRRHRGSGIAMVFQDPARSLNPTMRVGHQITEAIRHHQRVSAHDARTRAIELLELMRVPAPAQRFAAYPHELSGGLCQRVMIAIAVAGNPRVLIADEATRSLDAITQAQTLRLLKDLQRHYGMSLIVVSHDLRLAESVADDVLVMYAGRAVECAPSARLFGRARMRYTKALLDAIPHLERPPHTPFAMIPTPPLDGATLAVGCPFEPRCDCARDLCREVRPTLEEKEHGHSWACWNPCEIQEPV